MILDMEKLETLAEVATPGRWSPCGSYVAPTREDNGTTYVENWRSIALVSRDADREYIAAANPAAVLELIADVKRFRWLMRQDQFTAEQYIGYLCIDVVRSAIDAAMAQESDQ